MRRLAACLLVAATLAGCGLGSDREIGGAGARLDVTRGFGQVRLASASVAHVRNGETALSLLRSRRRISTSHGGDLVQSVDGLARNRARQRDWFYFVNGIEGPAGAAAYKLSPGDVVQWDNHDWRAADHVPAIVGAYPEPFVHGLRGKRLPTRLECSSPSSGSCKSVQQRLSAQGVIVSGAPFGSGSGEGTIRVVVGPWSSVKQVKAAAALEQGPGRSGVFVRFGSSGTLAFLDPQGRTAGAAPAGTGLLAATKPEASGPVWIVTGDDEAAAQRAAAALDPAKLRDAFAVAATPTGLVRLPVGGDAS